MVLDVAVGECVCAELVFARVFRALSAGDEAALEVGVLGDVDLVAVIACVNAALFGNACVLGVDFALTVTAAGTEAVAYGDLRTGILLFAVLDLLFYLLNNKY